jgi:hypothetical protein
MKALGSRPRTVLTAVALAILVVGAGCSSDAPLTATGGSGSTAPGASGSGIGSSPMSNGSTPGTGTSGASTGTGGAASVAGGSGVPATSGAGGVASSDGGTGTGVGGDGLPHPTNSDHCLYGYPPEPTDETMAFGPATFKTSSGDDTILQPEVLKWMTDNHWMGAHVVWHAVRGCNSGAAGGLLNPLGFPNICQDYPVLVPKDQNCQTAGDGYQFLLFHRHMLQALKQLWPKHAADFAGFTKFPTSPDEVPEVWKSKTLNWTKDALDAAAIGDNIEQHLDMFPDEGALGFWLQCQPGVKLAAAPNMPWVGIHFNLHDMWSRGAASEHGLNNGQKNVTNYMFWKLHGWIDNVWEKYRVAKGLTTPNSPEMQKYTQDMKQSCNEMDIEIEILKGTPGSGPVLDCPPDVDETGDFHTKVRPIFETATNHCASCHGPSQTSPYADLTLGGSVSSKCIVDRLKHQSFDGGQFKLVEPGHPEKSYLYLKASGTADTAGCVSNDTNKPCNTAAMPPGGKTMTDAELEILRKWIADGANYP